MYVQERSIHAPFSRTPKNKQDMFLYQNHQIYLSSYVFTTDELGIEKLHLVQKNKDIYRHEL